MRRDIAAIILGAHEWPFFEGLKSSESFLNSANEFKDYLLGSDGLDIFKDNLLPLFDDDRSVDIINRDIETFLKKASKDRRINNLIIYYTGHGAFITPKEYCLALKATQKASLDTSAYRMASLAKTVNISFPKVDRKFVIIDACFAAAGAGDWFPQDASSDDIDGQATAKRMEDQTIASLGAQGTALLCAASSADAALAPLRGTYTMFSDGLLHALTQGLATSSSSLLCFDDLRDLVNGYIENKFKHEGVRSEIHVPDQRRGDISDYRFFPNPAIRLSRVLERIGRLETQFDNLSAQQKHMEESLTSVCEDQLPKLMTILKSAGSGRKLSVDAGEPQTSLPPATDSAGKADLLDDMPVDVEIAFLKASKASLYARALVIIAWIFLAIVVTKEISNFESLTTPSSLIVLVAVLGAPTLTTLMLRGIPYQPIDTPEINLPWLRDARLMEVASRDYRLMPGGIVLETNPCYLGMAMLWLIVIMKIWHHIPAF